ncbi:MAG: hypothetical protein GF383_03980 [Candidatus Lokiarchaeota archaeon]|nr:hypothetical protein [Candidatus Lokiarchaeota archaeon]MBD3338884.1 hypothetical protein [Candidatus Lokiarchaeota archaeon]
MKVHKSLTKIFNKIGKKKFLVFSSIIFFILLLNLSIYGYSSPDQDPDEDCHDSGPYDISSDEDDEIEVDRDESFKIDIEGTGPDVIVRFNTESLDNAQFEVEPSNQDIADNSEFDDNDDDDIVEVEFELTAPTEKGTYEILFYVRSPPGNPSGQPYIDYLEFEIIVEEASDDTIVDNTIFNTIFNHYNIYLGLSAIICLSIGTVLAEINYRRFNRSHAIFTALALILTTVNLVFMFWHAVSVFGSWFFSSTVDWLHFTHYITGTLGFGGCIVGFLGGLSGVHHKKAGYLALACWGFNFVFGIIYWGIGLGVFGP